MVSICSVVVCLFDYLWNCHVAKLWLLSYLLDVIPLPLVEFLLSIDSIEFSDELKRIIINNMNWALQKINYSIDYDWNWNK